MGIFQNIINRVKNTYTNIKTYLTQPVRNRAGQVVGNRITIFGRDIRENIKQRLYGLCINKISMVVIFHLTTFVRNMYEI